MTTGLDIIDTAVKIGLGALISGLATYLITNQKNEHDLQKEHWKRKMDLLENIAIGLQKATTSMMKTVHVYLEIRKEDKHEMRKIMADSLEEYLNVFNELNLVDGYSSLLGEKDLSIGLEEFNKASMELYFFFLRDNIDNRSEYDRIVDKINTARDKLPNILSNIYAKQNG